DGANNTVQSLSVTVTDTNDNAPHFTSSATPSVPENTTAVRSEERRVGKEGSTNRATLHITGGADAAKFTITGGNHLEFVSAPTVDGPRDELVTEVQLGELPIYDGANNTVQSLSVTVTDTNDNAPHFTSSATPSVPENTTAV